MATQDRFDVVVAGAGNAALSAALSAAEQGASVVVLEKGHRHDDRFRECEYCGTELGPDRSHACTGPSLLNKSTSYTPVSSTS